MRQSPDIAAGLPARIATPSSGAWADTYGIATPAHSPLIVHAALQEKVAGAHDAVLGSPSGQPETNFGGSGFSAALPSGMPFDTHA